jgi:hypothetical protein
MAGDEQILEKIYHELIIIRKRLEAIERAIIPEEELSSEEMVEIKRLREETLRGEVIPWEDIKKRIRDEVED